MNFLSPPVTETIGRTSAEPVEFVIEPDHLVRLIERHEISAPVPRDLTAAERKLLWARATGDAYRWAEDEGLDIVGEVQCFDDVDTLTCGVWWEVVVGNAVPRVDLYGVPSAVSGLEQHTWTWSARWLHWAAWFRSMQARDRAEERAALGRDETVVVALPDVHGRSTLRTVPDDRPLIVDDECGTRSPHAMDHAEWCAKRSEPDVPSELRAAGPWAE